MCGVLCCIGNGRLLSLVHYDVRWWWRSPVVPVVAGEEEGDAEGAEAWAWRFLMFEGGT